jgi:hypothetical protein
LQKEKKKGPAMLVFDLLIALLVALLLTSIVVLGFRRTGPWASFLLLFFVIFLATWAGGIWLLPFGRPLGGVYWLPFLMVGIIFALLLSSIVPWQKEEESSIKLVTQKEKKAQERSARRRAGLLFWVFVGTLVLAIILHYVGV